MNMHYVVNDFSTIPYRIACDTLRVSIFPDFGVFFKILDTVLFGAFLAHKSKCQCKIDHLLVVNKFDGDTEELTDIEK